jgi:transketolase
MATPADLKAKADHIREDVIDVCVPNGAGHIAPSLSCVDILVALYYSALNRTDDPTWARRDRLVFSKGHGCYGLYSVLADIGYLEQSQWQALYKGSLLSGCIERNPAIGIETSCGALGHGVPMATGIAFGAKLQNHAFRTYCIVGDGEMQEGTNWEALQFGVKHGLGNFALIVDANGLQAMDFVRDVLTVGDVVADLSRKCAAFGCTVEVCDGHDAGELAARFGAWAGSEAATVPHVFLARTTKGFGLTCMENVPRFHFRLPTAEELSQGRRYE